MLPDAMLSLPVASTVRHTQRSWLVVFIPPSLELDRHCLQTLCPIPNVPKALKSRTRNGKSELVCTTCMTQHLLSDPPGRAIHLLQQTIPDFFQLGLVTSFDKVTGKPSPSHYIPIGDLHSLTSKEDVESIYDSRVILSYTPPSRLPPPFPQTLQIESNELLIYPCYSRSHLASGFPLYLASSMFLRHTLNALYSDVKVALNKTAVTNPPSSSSDGGPSPSRTRHRDKTFFIGVSVQGINRVTGARAEWEVYASSSVQHPEN